MRISEQIYVHERAIDFIAQCVSTERVSRMNTELTITVLLAAYFMISSSILVEFILLLPFLIDTAEESDRRSTSGQADKSLSTFLTDDDY